MSQAPAPAEPPVVQPTPATAQNIATGQEHMIPKSRMDEVLAENKRLREAQEARDKTEREQTEKQARDQGKFKELADQKDAELLALRPQVVSATARQQALEATMATTIADRVKALPDAAKKMFARLGDDVLVQFAALPELEALVGPADQRSGGTSAGPRGSGATTTADGPSFEDLKNENRARIGGL